MNDIETVAEAYRARFEQFGDNPRGVFWNNQETQELRFERLFKEVLPLLKPEFSVLDVGSGSAALHGYLLGQSQKHRYAGIEIVPEMVDVSRRKYPEIEVHEGDFIEWQTDRKFDVCVLSGTLNMPAGAKDWETRVFDTVSKMFRMSEVAASFNFLTGHSDFRDPSLFYMLPESIFTFCNANCSRFVTIDNGYPLYEFTVTVFHEEAVKRRFPQPEYQKYFK
jgi:SAM-dependent methyltransferase